MGINLKISSVYLQQSKKRSSDVKPLYVYFNWWNWPRFSQPQILKQVDTVWMRDHKRREFVRIPSFQGLSSFCWKWIYHVFYHFSRLIHKVLWNPSHPDRCCPGKKGEASRLYVNDVTWYHNDRRDKGEGVKGEVTRSAQAVPVPCSFSISTSSLTCQCSPSSKVCLEHIEVQVLSSPFQWCSIQFWDEFNCRKYYESKSRGETILEWENI